MWYKSFEQNFSSRGTFIPWFEKFVLNIHKILNSILINKNLDYLQEFLNLIK